MDAAMLNLDVSSDIAARIIAAADQLFAECGKSTMPNVDTVRRKARVSMNDASRVMRVWRKEQTTAATPLPDFVPNRVKDAGQALLCQLWNEAVETANSSLTAAQAGWEAERGEAESVRAQLASAFDEQSQEMESLQASLHDALAQIDNLQRQADIDAHERASHASRIEALATDAKNAHHRCVDLQHHIDDMRDALARAQEQTTRMHLDSTHAAETASTEIARLHAELLRSVERLTVTQEEFAEMRRNAGFGNDHGTPKRRSKNASGSASVPVPTARPPGGRTGKRSGNGGS